MARNNDEAIAKMQKASAYADLLEIRLDSFEKFDLSLLTKATSRPLIVTYRSRKEGGMGNASYSLRIQYLEKAISLGVQYVDLEYGLPLEWRAPILNNPGRSKIIISKHIRHKTPDRPALKQWVQKLIATGAHVIKLVTMANTVEDNIRVLELIPLARQFGVPVITFCMGEKGKISRVASIFMGAFLTFACLDDEQPPAPGQIGVKQMRKIMELLDASN